MEIARALLSAGAWSGYPRRRAALATRFTEAGYRPEDVHRLAAKARELSPKTPGKLVAGWIEGDAATLNMAIVELREKARVSHPMYVHRELQIETLSQKDLRTEALRACRNLLHEGWSPAEAAASTSEDYRLTVPLTEADVPPRKGPSDEAKYAIQTMIRNAKEEQASG